jgi:hypothetical protein
LFRIAGAKVRLFLELPKLFGTFFYAKPVFLVLKAGFEQNIHYRVEKKTCFRKNIASGGRRSRKNAYLCGVIFFKMRIPFHIIELLKSKSGSDLRLPSDCELLSLDIESRTGIHIGATTLKRLLGFAQDERSPHTSTLDAIAHYLGFAHWDELAKIEAKGNSNFGVTDDEIRSADLSAGSYVEITYLPDRRLLMQYLGGGRYRVAEAENSKLAVGDEVEIQSFVLRHPLLVAQVWRGGEPLGPFTAGRVAGLSSVRIVER